MNRMQDNALWRALPFQGAPIRAFSFEGNPKDGEAVIELTDGCKVVVPTHDLEMSFAAGIEFRMRIRGWDDVNFEQRVEWPTSHQAVLSSAEVLWWDEEANWNLVVASWTSKSTKKRWELGTVVPLRIRFT